jgi:hypothetical protein
MTHMRILSIACVLTTLTSLAVACGSSDEKRAIRSAEGGGGAGALPGGALGGRGAKEETSGAGGTGYGSSVTAGFGGAEAFGGQGGVAGASCDSAAELGQQLQGNWLICGAVATNGRIWNGLIAFDTPASACAGPVLSASLHWLTTNAGISEGNTAFHGSYDAQSGVVTLEEYEVTGGDVVQATDTFKYDPDTDTLVDGAWTCSCSPGSWRVATRVSAGTDVDDCPQ